MAFTSASGDCGLTIALDRPLRCFIKAGPGGLSTPICDVLIEAHTGDLAAGQEATFSARVSVSGHADHSPAHLRLDATKDLYRLDGFGGTYVYWPDTVIMPYTIEHLRPAWGRTQMSLDQWATHDPASIDWHAYRNRDTGDWGLWVLEGELYAATLLNQHHIPIVISDWRVPPSMREPGGGGRGASAGRRGRS